MQLTKTNHVTVNVIDSIMGSGKTTWMIETIKQDKHPKYIVVTPTLSEVTRIIKECPNAQFKEPETKQHTKKYFSLRELIKDGDNIVTTHAMFKYMTQEILSDIQLQGYNLLVDEALTCVEIYDEISPKDLRLIFENNLVYVEPETYRLCWNNDEHGDYKGRFDEIKRRCTNGNLVYFKERTMLWEFPMEFLSAFKSIWIMTYMFRGSTMANYLQADGTTNVMYSLKGKSARGLAPTLIPYSENNEKEIKDSIRELVDVYEGKLNDIGQSKGKRHNPLSKNWFQNTATEDEIKQIKRNLYSFFRYQLNSKSEDNIWTTFGSMKHKAKGIRGKLRGKGYDKGFISNNTKATNSYIDKQNVAYVQNTFYHPTVASYFTERNVVVHNDLHALSEMLQLIWRTRIRKFESINVYVPSSRMRGLLQDWLDSNNDKELSMKISANK